MKSFYCFICADIPFRLYATFYWAGKVLRAYVGGRSLQSISGSQVIDQLNFVFFWPNPDPLTDFKIENNLASAVLFLIINESKCVYLPDC